MDPEELNFVKNLLSDCRVLSLGVLVDGKPHVGLLPFVVATDYRSALIHASQLSRHSRGLQPGFFQGDFGFVAISFWRFPSQRPITIQVAASGTATSEIVAAPSPSAPRPT